MNLKPYLTSVRVVATVAGLFAFVLFLSFVAGQCRKWSSPPVPKPVPPIIDLGTPTPGRAAEAPTVTEQFPVARPDLTRAEVEAYAKKYGLTLRPAGTQASAKPSTLPGASPSEIEPPAPAQTFPLFLGEESFKHAPSGVDVDVSAWIQDSGQRVDLRATWRTWTPPEAPSSGIQPCQKDRFFGNEARFVKEVGAGFVYGNGKAGLGGWGSVAYRGPRTGAVTWGGRAFGAFSNESGAVGVGGFTASW